MGYVYGIRIGNGYATSAEPEAKYEKCDESEATSADSEPKYESCDESETTSAESETIMC